MLKEHKVKKTPEEKKKAHAAKMNKNAALLYERILPIAIQPTLRKLDSSSADRESLRIELANVLKGTAAIAVDAAVAFEEVWKKKKGQFLAD